MPLTPAPTNPLPFFWSFYGHSYYQGNFGAHGPAGRADSIMRSLFSMEQASQTKNHAMVGSRLTWNGNAQAGWTRLIQNEKGNLVNPGYPDICYDGAFFLGWGINDLGNAGNTTQHNTAYQHAMRTCISRCRSARVYDDGNAAFTYGTAGTGFAVQNFQWETTSGDTYHSATVTTTATISWTVPADYHGAAIVFCFLSKPGVLGATFTFGGTAGITGTVSTSNILPAASGAGRIPVVRRITTLTAANAGQTITIAATAIDGGGSADFLGAWIESPYPPPILVANTARMNALGYANYTFTYTSSLTGTAVASTPATITLASGTTLGLPTAGSVTCPSAGGTVTISWTGGPGTTLTTLTGVTVSGGSGNYSSNTLTYVGPTDADVNAFNAALLPVLAEFDGMVQLVDLDAALNKDVAALGSDGLHPSELGAARIADAWRAAAFRCAPSSAYGPSSQMNVPNRSLVPLYLPKLSGGWYTTPGCTIPGTAYTPVAQDMFAIPFTCTSQGEVWIKWSMETLAGGTVAPTVLMGIYDDRNQTGLPKHIYSAPTATPITLAAAGVFNSPGSGNGQLILGPDPGLYWLVVLIVTIGTGVTFRTIKGPSLLMPNLASTGGAATTVCGWKAATAGTVLPASWPFPFDPGLNTMSDNCPMIGININ